MSSWTAGYVADLTYTHGFYRELTPSILAFAALVRGMRAPAPEGRLTYCELGCGQGVTANLLAAANPQAEIHAVDFNPAQVAGARALAAEAGTPNVTFHERAFADLAAAPDLPRTFDMIVLHGIWSWISAENRAHVVAFIRDRLAPGGLAYVSYNALPGWAAAMPLRRLFVDHAAAAAGPLRSRIDGALDFAGRVMAAEPAWARAVPGVAERLARIRGQDRAYLAHEYFNRDWTPFYHADVAAELAEAKLTHVGTTHLLDHVDAVDLTEAQQALLAETADPALRETLRDFLVNRQFRRDLYVKGAVPLPLPRARDRWLDTRFALTVPRSAVPLKVTGARGEAQLQAAVYDPVLDALADGPRTLRQMVEGPAVAALGWARVTQALMVLVGAGHLDPALPPKGEDERTRRARAFNAAVMGRAQASADLQCLAAPVTGGGVTVDRFEQLFLLARQARQADGAAFAWAALEAVDQRIVKDGAPLETAEANLAELRTRHETFVAVRLPLLRSLGMA